ncbi:HD superfamily phosphohydrolase [Methanocalculus alkaliphilus]|uniref:HD domain-containing protein n=1 Tax=Methanocalculus alkaliphilus TaxID=768730 RepID=UPI0020A22DD6|nr:HD domain-containing protein [Methanocalculus alkaliphilus]MCP1716067.1 HD superfamily phosphohydrolase [Methanocalculus alkaliphilus]
MHRIGARTFPGRMIKDPVHGDIEVDAGMERLLDTPPLQRLRMIRQLGFSFLVYPGANHTRFEHALGTMHLATHLCRHLSLEAGETDLLRAAALLHDIGHGPFSHASEPVMEVFCGHGHDRVRDLLDDPATASALAGMNLDPDEVAAVIAGKHRLAGVIHGELDVDRMDYLHRDAHYTGVPYGAVDANRIIRSTLLSEEGLVLDESGVQAAESLLVARTLMRPAVYYHHVSRIAERMFLIGAMAHCEEGGDQKELVRMDDPACIMALRESESGMARSIIHRLLTRDLYKRAVYVGVGSLNRARIPQPDLRDSFRLAGEIADAAGVDPGSVAVDIPPFPHDLMIGVSVKNRHDIVSLDEISPLIRGMNEIRRSQWRLGIYAPAEHRDRVAAAAAEVLNLRPVTKQDKLLIDTDEEEGR